MSNGDDVTTAVEVDRLGTFQNLQASISSTHRARPPPMLFSTREDEAVRVPLKLSKLHRSESKGGIRSMFTRNKAEKISIAPLPGEPLRSGFSHMSMNEVAEKSLPLSISMKRVSTNHESTPHTPVKSTSKPSRMNLRSKTAKHSKTTGTPTPKSASKASPKSTTRPLTRTSAAWDPPPLFQAYPQAIKHAQLPASTLSADSILRISNQNRNNSLRDEIAQTKGNNEGEDQSTSAKKSEKAKSKHRRQISGSISKADWTQKIFVLVTSGYLLQYSGEGSFDRLPEKMMQLGKDSVAFASDVIPGKHWVLQISQSMDSEGVPTADSRSLLSRLAFRGADYRRTATSLLLVLTSAEEMDSWIAVVRREIEALGGKKHVSETGKPKPDDKIMQLKAQPSHRYLVQRNPDRFSNPSSPASPNFGPPPWNPDGNFEAALQDAAFLARAMSATTQRPLTGHQSIANSSTSHDGRQLDNSRDSTNRLSFMSSGQRTLVTSRGSSRENSPTRESTSTIDDFQPKLSVEDTRPRPNAHAINERRRSMQTVQISLAEVQPKPFRPHSTFGVLTRPPQNGSPTTPNFSVPIFSSKRYSTVKAPAPEVTSVPTIVTTTPSKTMLKGTRKAPPTALRMIRPLSPVTDSPTPKPTPPIYTPTESSFKKVQQVRASVIDIPARSPVAPSSPTETELPRRFSSLTPLNSTLTSHINFQFPRRHSSMQYLRESIDKVPDAPSRAPPLPPATLTTPLPVSPFIVEPGQLSPELQAEIDKEALSPLPILASAKPKLRRPTSMQIQPSNLSQSTVSPAFTMRMAKQARFQSSIRLSPSVVSSETFNHEAISPGPPISLKSPSIRRLNGQPSPRSLSNRRSMPILVNSPPPAPPPDCALPPLPPGNLKSPVGLRNPVQV